MCILNAIKVILDKSVCQIHKCKYSSVSAGWCYTQALKGKGRLRVEQSRRNCWHFHTTDSGPVHDSLLLSIQMPQRIRLKLINGCYYNATHPNQTCHISRGTLPCFHWVCVCVVILEEGSVSEIERAHWGQRCNQIWLIHMTSLLAFPAISFPILCCLRNRKRKKEKKKGEYVFFYMKQGEQTLFSWISQI